MKIKLSLGASRNQALIAGAAAALLAASTPAMGGSAAEPFCAPAIEQAKADLPPAACTDANVSEALRLLRKRYMFAASERCYSGARAKELKDYLDGQETVNDASLGAGAVSVLPFLAAGILAESAAIAGLAVIGTAAGETAFVATGISGVHLSHYAKIDPLGDHALESWLGYEEKPLPVKVPTPEELLARSRELVRYLSAMHGKVSGHFARVHAEIEDRFMLPGAYRATYIEALLRESNFHAILYGQEARALRRVHSLVTRACAASASPPADAYVPTRSPVPSALSAK